MVGIVLLFISVFLVFTGKAIADTVSNEVSWANSIFSKNHIESFWGSKDRTWKRKYRENKIMNYLFSTILVWTTDIWHFANTIRRIGIYLGILAALIVNTSLLNELIIVSTYILLNVVGFHLLYTYILKK